MKRNFSATFWVISLIIAAVLCYIPTPAPLDSRWGDVYRGWPWIYGLDQGDVKGDEYAFMTTYFHPIPFALNVMFAMSIALAISISLNWVKDIAKKNHHDQDHMNGNQDLPGGPTP